MSSAEAPSRVLTVVDQDTDPVERPVHRITELELDADTTPDSKTGHLFASFRQKHLNVVNHVWFERIVMTVILANSICLCLYLPTEPLDSGRNLVLSRLDTAFTVIFMIEFYWKVVALGRKYFKDAFNWLDFSVVVIGIVEWLPVSSGGNMSAIRTLRVLRPLRTLNAFPGLRLLVTTVVSAMPSIMTVAALEAYLMVLFGIFGISTYSGVLKYRCVLTSSLQDPRYYENDNDYRYLVFDEDQYCTTLSSSTWEGFTCAEDYTCHKVHNPMHGFQSFDTLLWALLLIFQAITLEGWTDVMYATMDATSGWSCLYYIAVVFIGNFFLLNLALAVISDIHTQAKEAQAEEDEAQKTLEAAAHQSPVKAAEEEEPISPVAAAAARIWMKKALKPPDEKPKWKLGDFTCTSEGWSALNKFIAEQKYVRRVTNGFDKVVSSHFFEPCSTVLILANTIVLASNYATASEGYRSILDSLNEFCSIMFFVEMLLVLIAKGPWEYSKEPFNLFDAFINLMSLISWCTNSDTSIASALRGLRILRVLKIAGKWGPLQAFLVTMFRTCRELGNFTTLVILTVMIFALLGMQLFGGKYTLAEFPDGIPRSNFNSLYWSIITVFQVLSGEDWNVVMNNEMRSAGTMACLYFMLLVMLGNFVVMNLFIAILLSSFEEHRQLAEEEEKAKALARAARREEKSQLKREREEQESIESRLRSQSMSRKFHHLVKDAAKQNEPEERSDPPSPEKKREAKEAIAEVRRRSSDGQSQVPTHLVSMSGTEVDVDEDEDEDAAVPNSYTDVPMKPLAEFKNKSLFLFTTDNPIRRAAYNLVSKPAFDNTVLVLIMVSSVTMAVENPDLMDNKDVDFAFYVVDTVFTALFLLEMLLKQVAYGLWGDDRSYLSDSWNVLDGVIVTFSLINLVPKSVLGGGLDLSWVRAVRTLRVLRPLRMINRVPELKVVVNALLGSIPSIWSVIIVSFIFLLIFAILGMELFMGRLNYCTDPDPEITKETCSGTFNETTYDYPSDSNITVVHEREWLTYDQNFDDIFHAITTLFEMCTTEMWLAVMYTAIDARGSTKNPVRNHNEWVGVFFVVFVIFGSFFLVNLFVGIIMDNFAVKKKEMADDVKGIFLSQRQRQWRLKMKQYIKREAKKISQGKKERFLAWARDPALRFVNWFYFRTFIVVCIVLNVMVMATYHAEQGAWWTTLQESADTAFTLIFIVEASIKIFAMGPALYFADPWNNMDFFVAVTCLLFETLEVDVNTSMLRVLRITRMLRIVKNFKSFCRLLDTLFLALPKLVNVGGLLVLLFFMYAVLGVSLFGEVNRHQEYLNRNANFRTFPYAMLTLFRASTGEAWNGIMYDLAELDDCDDDDNPNHDNGCGLPTFAYLYFISFTCLGNFIALNLFLAVVLENYSDTDLDDDDDEENAQRKEIEHADLEAYKNAFEDIDRSMNGYVLAEDVLPLLRKLHPPLGLHCTPQGDLNVDEMRALKIRLRPVIEEGQENLQASFSSILYSLSYFHLRDPDDPEYRLPDKVMFTLGDFSDFFAKRLKIWHLKKAGLNAEVDELMAAMSPDSFSGRVAKLLAADPQRERPINEGETPATSPDSATAMIPSSSFSESSSIPLSDLAGKARLSRKSSFSKAMHSFRRNAGIIDSAASTAEINDLSATEAAPHIYWEPHVGQKGGGAAAAHPHTEAPGPQPQEPQESSEPVSPPELPPNGTSDPLKRVTFYAGPPEKHAYSSRKYEDPIPTTPSHPLSDSPDDSIERYINGEEHELEPVTSINDINLETVTFTRTASNDVSDGAQNGHHQEVNVSAFLKGPSARPLADSEVDVIMLEQITADQMSFLDASCTPQAPKTP